MDSKEKKKEKLPINYMINESMDQQLTTLNKLNKEKKNANDATNGATTGKHLERDSGAAKNPDIKLGEKSSDDKSPAKRS